VPVEDFTTAVDRLLSQVGHWTQPRWSATPGPATPANGAPGPARPGDGGPGPAVSSAASGPGTGEPKPAERSRAGIVHALVQRLADLVADAEGRPHRPVPRVGDLVLPDQLRVMRDDLVIVAADDILKLATDDVDAVRRVL
jgi:hypothetical protein